MKQKVFILIILALIFSLSSCKENKKFLPEAQNDSTFSVIGLSEKEEKKPIRMIRVDDELYYDTGIVSDVPRCGTLDGDLTKATLEYEIPQNNGEANFSGKGDYFGYQHQTSISKVVTLEEGFTIFKKVPDYGKDISGYKYAFLITGRHPNAQKDSEYIVLSNTLSITFEQLTKYFFSSQFEDHLLDIHVIFPEISDKWGIMMYADDVTKKGLTIKIERFGGEASGELQTSDWYSLEEMKDDKWVEVPKKLSDELFAWHSVAYKIPEYEVSEFEVDWEWIYGELPSGEYRITKEIMDFRGTGDFDKKMYQTTFKIK